MDFRIQLSSGFVCASNSISLVSGIAALSNALLIYPQLLFLKLSGKKFFFKSVYNFD